MHEGRASHSVKRWTNIKRWTNTRACALHTTMRPQRRRVGPGGGGFSHLMSPLPLHPPMPPHLMPAFLHTSFILSTVRLLTDLDEPPLGAAAAAAGRDVGSVCWAQGSNQHRSGCGKYPGGRSQLYCCEALI